VRPIEPYPQVMLAHPAGRDWRLSPITVPRPAAGAREHYLTCRHCRRPVTCTILSAAETARSRRRRAGAALASLAGLAAAAAFLAVAPGAPAVTRVLLALAVVAGLAGVLASGRGWLAEDGVRLRDDPAGWHHALRGRPRSRRSPAPIPVPARRRPPG
jgi:hypothetical protein